MNRVLLVVSALLLTACGGGDSNPNPATAERVAPRVDAGQDQTRDEGSEIILMGQASADQALAIRRVSWRQADADTIRAILPDDSDQSSIRFNAPQVDDDTALTFIFRVEDTQGQVSEDSLQVLVRDVIANALPVARAGMDQTINHNDSTIMLNGCDSFDPDGQITRYLWQAVDTLPPTTVGDRCDTVVAQSMPSAAETIQTFRLTVTDNEGATAQDHTRVTKRAQPTNRAPNIEATQARPSTASPGESVQLLVTASDPDANALTYEWTQLEGGERVFIAQANTANAMFEAPAAPADLRFKVVVSDGVDQREDTVVVMVRNPPPTAAPSLISCLINPSQMGCFPAGVGIPGGDGSAAEPRSAGQCNPTGDANWPHFTGMLHEHTAYSDGFQLTDPDDVFRNGQEKGWSFAISTDHSDNMGLPFPVVIANDPEFCATNPAACLLSDPENITRNLTKWQETQRQAEQASTPTFTAMRGFEWTSDRFGHANVLLSRHYINPKTGPGYLVTMEAFWAWFISPASLGGGNDGLLVFNHPGREDALHGPLMQLKTGLNALPLATLAEQSPLPANPLQDLLTAPGDPAYTFNDFRYVPSADYRVVGIEVFGKGDEYDTDGKKHSWFAYALDKGWYLAPTGSEDHHDTRWGDEDLPKTVLIAASTSRQDLREALLARRTYAVAQNYNHELLNFSAHDESGAVYPMGSRLALSSENIRLTVNVRTRPGQQTPRLRENTRIELMSSLADNEESYQPLMTQQGSDQAVFTLPMNDAQAWAFVRIRDGEKIIAVSAPIWFKRADAPLPSCP